MIVQSRRKAILTHSQSVSQSVSQAEAFTWPNYLLKSQKILLAQAMKRLTLCMYGSRS